MEGQGGGTEDERRPIIQQNGDHGAGRERQRLPHAHLIGEEQTRLAVGLPVLQKHRHERTLPGLQLLSAPIDRALGERRAGQLFDLRLLEANLQALGDALDLFDDGLGQRVGVLPERLELLFDPGNALGRCVLPQNLVVLGEGALCLVD